MDHRHLRATAHRRDHQLFEAGATHVFVRSGQSDQNAVLDFYGSSVLPHLPT
jgi:hypothetical protein